MGPELGHADLHPPPHDPYWWVPLLLCYLGTCKGVGGEALVPWYHLPIILGVPRQWLLAPLIQQHVLLHINAQLLHRLATHPHEGVGYDGCVRVIHHPYVPRLGRACLSASQGCKDHCAHHVLHFVRGLTLVAS